MAFSDLVGHSRTLRLLAHSIARETLPPSLLFGGPAGVGKFRAAEATAQALNCLAPKRVAGEVDACRGCATCRRISRRIHPDVQVIEPEESGSIKVDQVREAIDRAAYRPFEGRRRVVIIDEADALVPQGQSALLKTLEEPRPASVFILVTSRPDALLATVRSRCSRLRFGRLSADAVAEALVRDHGYTSTDAHAVAALSDGSIGQALQAQAVDFVAARRAAHTVLRQAARTGDPRQRLQSAHELTLKAGSSADQRDHLAVHLRAMSSLVRDVGILTTRADDRALANPDLKAELERLTGVFDSGRAMRAFTAVDWALGAVDRNAGPKVVADWLVLQL